MKVRGLLSGYQLPEWVVWISLDHTQEALARITRAQVFEWSGCITGVIGAGLLALNNRWSGFGFLFFLLANGCWITFGVMTAAWGLVVMQVFCTGTSMLGIWKWLLKGRCNRSGIAIN